MRSLDSPSRTGSLTASPAFFLRRNRRLAHHSHAISFMTSISSDVLKQLARFDTPTICNIIELFDVRPRNRGYMDGRIRAGFPEMPPMVGFASTAAFRMASRGAGQSRKSTSRTAASPGSAQTSS